MKKAIVAGFIFILFLSLSSLGSEKSWLQTFTRNMRARHTYEKDSLAHQRDAAILYLLPAATSQKILAQQRSNMQKFLEQNEVNARESLRRYFNLDQEQWSKIMKTFEKEHEFNLNAMKQTDTHLGTHDENLPQEYYDTIDKECNRYGINKNNLKIGITTDKSFAGTIANRPFFEEYNPAMLKFNLQYLSECDHHKLAHTTMHEFTHLIQGHSLLTEIILNEVTQLPEINKKLDLLLNQKVALDNIDQYNNEMKEILKQLKLVNIIQNHYLTSNAKAILKAAEEKTADTYILCEDRQAAQEAVKSIESMKTAGFCSYPDNYNDIQVLHTNWELSERIEKRTQWHNAQSTKKCRKQFPLKFSGPSS